MAIEIINPDWSGQAHGPLETVAACTSGVQAVWAPLECSGQFRPVRFVFSGEQWQDATRDDCAAWVGRHRETIRTAAVRQTATRVLPVEMDATYGPEPTEDDLAIINRYALQEVAADQVYVRRMRLVHDDFHRDFMRFSRSSVQQMVDTLPGKSLLEGHDTSRAGLGLMFRGEIKREGRRTDGYAYFYMPRSGGNEHERLLIDTGVWRYVSVGFTWDWLQCDICGLNYMGYPDDDGRRCPHYLGEVYSLDSIAEGIDTDTLWLTDDGESVYGTATFRGKTTTREGSIVYLGALEDAEIVRASGIGTDFIARKHDVYNAGGGIDVTAIGDGGDAAGAAAAASGNSDDTADHGEPPDSAPETRSASGTGENDTAKEVDGAMAEEQKFEEQLAERQAKIDELSVELQAKSDEVRDLTSKLEVSTKREATFRAHEVAELERLATLTGNEATLAAFRQLSGESLEEMEPEKMLGLIAEWTAKHDERRPATQSDPAPTDEPPAAPPEDDAVDARRSSIL